jgi:hypothetical protein
MSELKTRFVDDTYVEYYNTGKHELAQIYLKSEADKVIARHKYKRCLAMAEWCNSGMVVETFACFRPRSTKEVWREEHQYWAKWRKIWFELAMKFKEAK